VIGVDNALPDEVRDAVTANVEDAGPVGPWSQGFGAMTPALDAQVAALERAISTAASLASAYLAAGWTVELVARGTRVPPGTGKLHEGAIGRALALLPYVSEDVAFSPLPPRIESVLVQPRGVAAANRPSAGTVIDA